MKKFSILLKEGLNQTSVIYDVKLLPQKTQFTFSNIDGGWSKSIRNKNALSITNTGNGIEIKTDNNEPFIIDYTAFELLAVYFKYLSTELEDCEVFSIDKFKPMKGMK